VEFIFLHSLILAYTGNKPLSAEVAYFFEWYFEIYVNLQCCMPFASKNAKTTAKNLFVLFSISIFPSNFYFFTPFNTD